jgi:hypothetical protein
MTWEEKQKELGELSGLEQQIWAATFAACYLKSPAEIDTASIAADYAVVCVRRANHHPIKE